MANGGCAKIERKLPQSGEVRISSGKNNLWKITERMTNTNAQRTFRCHRRRRIILTASLRRGEEVHIPFREERRGVAKRPPERRTCGGSIDRFWMPQRESSPVKFPAINGFICDCIRLTLFDITKEKSQFFNFDGLQGKMRSVHLKLILFKQ